MAQSRSRIDVLFIVLAALMVLVGIVLVFGSTQIVQFFQSSVGG